MKRVKRERRVLPAPQDPYICIYVECDLFCFSFEANIARLYTSVYENPSFFPHSRPFYCTPDSPPAVVVRHEYFLLRIHVLPSTVVAMSSP